MSETKVAQFAETATGRTVEVAGLSTGGATVSGAAGGGGVSDPSPGTVIVVS